MILLSNDKCSLTAGDESRLQRWTDVVGGSSWLACNMLYVPVNSLLLEQTRLIRRNVSLNVVALLLIQLIRPNSAVRIPVKSTSDSRAVIRIPSLSFVCLIPLPGIKVSTTSITSTRRGDSEQRLRY